MILSCGIVVLAALSFAQQQTIEKQETRIQVLGATTGGSKPFFAGMVDSGGHMGLLNVTGKPFSATETHRSVQMLANGAKIEHSDSNQFYRDDQGRTRAEQTFDGQTVVVIMDPVKRVVAILDPVKKTAHKSSIPGEMVKGAVSVSEGHVMVQMGTSGDPKSTYQLAVKDLGEKPINGWTAKGTRDTRTIKAGTIGNDRDLDIVDERWVSNDLQVLLKSVNDDPRFGETSYELTNIVRGPQDPTLFQVPADYSVVEGLK